MKRPLIYYFAAVFIGSISAVLVVMNQYIYAAVLAAFFLASIVFTVTETGYVVVIFLFGVISFINYIGYFEYTGFIYTRAQLRVSEKKTSYYISEYKGKLVYMKGILEDINEGEILDVTGSFNKEESDTQKGIVGTYYVENVNSKNIDFIGRMYRFKKELYNTYEEVLGNTKAAMVSSVCFGDVSHLEQSEKDKFNKLGILHVVSVSGLHLAIIYKLLEGIGGIKLALPISFLYTVFTGMESATLRAFIMIFMLNGAKKVFKKYDPYSALSLSAIILILYRPYYVTDVGFNLSFLSMLGVFLYYKKLKIKFISLPAILNDAISLSLSAQSMSIIYLIAVMNNFSPGFLIGNIFLMPIFSVLVVAGNLSMVLINIKALFKVSIFIINIILTIIEGGQELLMKVCPKMIYLGYEWAMYIAVIYVSYSLYCAGKRKCLYLPLFILPIIFLNNYKFIPEINYMRSFYNYYIVVKYKDYNMLIVDKSNKKILEDDKIIEVNNIDEKILLEDDKTTIKVNGYELNFMNTMSKKSFMPVVINFGDKEKLIICESYYDNESSFKGYDIIRLKYDSVYENQGVVACFLVIPD